MKSRSYWGSSSVDGLVTSLQDQDNDISVLASEALSTQSTLPKSAVDALIRIFRGGHSKVSCVAATALGNQSSLTDSDLSELINEFHGSDDEFKCYLAGALSSQLKMRESARKGLFAAFYDSEPFVTKIAIDALRDHPKLSSFVVDTLIESSLPVRAISSLIGASKDDDLDVAISAARALRAHSRSKFTLEDCLFLIRSNNWMATIILLETFGTQFRFEERRVWDLVDNLQAKDCTTRISAAVALGTYPGLPTSAITALINALKDRELKVAKSATRSLCAQSELNGSAIQNLVNMSKGRFHEDVWRAAAEVLCARSSLPAFAVYTLIRALDEDLGATNIVAQVLGAQSMLNGYTILATIRALHVKGWSTTRPDRVFEVKDTILGFSSSVARCKLPESDVLASVSALRDKDKSIRSSGAAKLGTQRKLPEYAIQALIRALDATDLDVMNTAALALDAQANLSDSAILSLFNTFHTKGWIITRSAVARLSYRAMLSERAIIAIINNLGDDLYSRRSEVPLPNTGSPVLDVSGMSPVDTSKDEHNRTGHLASPMTGTHSKFSDLS
ncbi:hypothetical protein BGX26_010964 [Mortierella sp. AD094]|nr:hypothetical protein BGX26_010964 [Mortierella sp. AD094]